MDGIQFPVDPDFPVELGADMVALTGGDGPIGIPYGKIMDGRPGGIVPLTVDDQGAARTGSRVVLGTGGGPIGQTSYLDAQVIGGAFKLADNSAALYEIHSAQVLMADIAGPSLATDPLPSFFLGLVGVADGTPLDSIVTDGFNLSDTPVEALTIVTFLPSALFVPNQDPSVPMAASVTRYPFLAGPGDNADIDIYGMVVADGPVATDLTAWDLLVSVTMTAVGTT